MTTANLSVILTESHWAIDGVDGDGCELAPDPRHSPSAKRFWRKCAFSDSCEKGVVVLDKDTGVAFARYTIEEKVLFMQGTWVEGTYQKQGIASKMWSAVLSKESFSRISAMSISKSGQKLLSSLSKSHPNLKWDIDK